ncbi:MAG: SRPBCC family protein [Solirubrobacteraceae bacterium]
MTEHQSSRTLVKSAPELWAECSDPASLARHLGAFGEIRITRLEPETTVAWEGAAACGTVELAPAGWGTRVTLTVTAREEQPPAAAVTEAGVDAEPAPQFDSQPPPESRSSAAPESTDSQQPAPESEPPAPPPAAQRTRGLARLFARWRAPAASSEPAPVEPPAAPSESTALEPTAARPESTALDPPAAPEQPAVTEQPAAHPEPALAQPEAREQGVPAPGSHEDPLAAALDSLGRAHHRPYSRA